MKAKMLTIAFIALLSILMLPLAAHPQAGRPSGGHQAPAGFVGIWYFRVDRAWNGSGSPGFPSSLLAESTYSPVSNGPIYRILISGTPMGFQISIGDPPIKGRQQPTGALQFVFYLQEGTFAGGRFLIMNGQDGPEGELTVYGSGLPIIKSERGALTR